MNQIFENIKDTFPKEMQEFEVASNNIVNHKMFKNLNNLENIKIYSEFQIWCVWDFMSILKKVQNLIFTNDIMWLPPKNPNVGAAFYKLIESEETDLGHKSGDLNRASHFQSFLASMKQMGADTTKIDNFIEYVREGLELETALTKAGASEKTKKFLLTNRELIEESPYNAISIITLTRENFLPAVFKSLMSNVKEEDKIELFVWYHKRHIHLDTVLHGPLSELIFNEYVNNDKLIKESILTSIKSLNARNELLSEINQHLK